MENSFVWLSNIEGQTIIYQLGELPWKPEYFLIYRMTMKAERTVLPKVNFRQVSLLPSVI